MPLPVFLIFPWRRIETGLAQIAGAALGATLLLAPDVALSQSGDFAAIDEDLREQLDFRDVAFADCFEQPTCTVLGLTITAERREVDGETWVSAQIYWDPVDGFGVIAGGQNDEIDFDERLLVTFEGIKGGTVNIERAWLSDIFIGEDERYGNNDPAGNDDVEVAVIQSMWAGSMVAEEIADGANVLPPDPFNAEVMADSREDGDLLRRVVINDQMISVIVPERSDSGAMDELRFQISEVDDAKLELFDGIETVELALTDVLVGFNDAPVYFGGSFNAEVMEENITDREALQELRESVEETRLVSDVSNGELGVAMDPSIDVDMLVFMSVFGGSNDYSVAGLVFAEGSSR